MSREPFVLNGTEVAPGSRVTLSMPVPGQSSYTPLAMPVHVIHGRKDGPVLFVSAAIHGDEVVGIEIIRQLLSLKEMTRLKGTLIAVPIVNVYGYLNHTRYLPDRRDLNRSFPGSEHGSLAARMAYVFTREIVDRATLGIDLHTGANHRANLPHIRTDLTDPECEALAQAFGAPVAINANLWDGSLRQYAVGQGKPLLLFEAGEALRFDKLSIRAGVHGIQGVMRHIGMLPPRKRRANETSVVEATASQWVRAPMTGLLRGRVSLGTQVREGDVLGHIADAIGENETDVLSPVTGLVIGHTKLPVINEGDALYHIARFSDATEMEGAMESFHEAHIEGLGEGDYPGAGEV